MKISCGFVSSLEAISAIFTQNYALFVKKIWLLLIKFYDMRRYTGESWYANKTLIINVKSSAFELI